MKSIYLKNAFALLLLMMLMYSCAQIDLTQFDNDSPFNESLCHDSSFKMTESSEYYWYHGDKIYLQIDSSRIYQVYRENTIQKFNTNALTINVSDKVDFNQKWAILDNSTKSSANKLLTNKPDIVYQSPCYIYNNNQIGVSHLVYVQLKNENDITVLQKIANELNVTIIGNNEYLPLWYTLSCSKDSKYNAIKTSAILYETGLFKECEPGLMANVSPCSSDNFSPSFNDPYYPNQWNLKGSYSINWEKATEMTLGKNNIIIGIYDSGIDSTNSDITQNMMSFDVLNKQYDYKIYDIHGTAVAGITSAIANNNYGIVGIAPNCTVFDICFCYNQDPDILQLIANGFCVAGENCDVINCSWHIDVRSSFIENAIDLYCHTWGRNNKGTIIVFAAGNNGASNVSYPGNSKEYIVHVGSITPEGKRSSFSNYGYLLDIVAPGENICTTDMTQSLGYGPSDIITNFNGTSAAAPHVTGVIALMLSVNPNLTDTDIKEILEKTANKIETYKYATYYHRPNGQWNQEVGYGLVDAYEAVKEAQARLQ